MIEKGRTMRCGPRRSEPSRNDSSTRLTRFFAHLFHRLGNCRQWRRHGSRPRLFIKGNQGHFGRDCHAGLAKGGQGAERQQVPKRQDGRRLSPRREQALQPPAPALNRVRPRLRSTPFYGEGRVPASRPGSRAGVLVRVAGRISADTSDVAMPALGQQQGPLPGRVEIVDHDGKRTKLRRRAVDKHERLGSTGQKAQAALASADWGNDQAVDMAAAHKPERFRFDGFGLLRIGQQDRVTLGTGPPVRRVAREQRKRDWKYRVR